MNSSLFIQPDALTNPSESCGAPHTKSSLKFFCGNTRTGGTEVIAAEAMAQTVTSSPLTWESTFPTCLLPFFAKIFESLCVVVHPVLSKLKMVHAVNFAFK